MFSGSDGVSGGGKVGGKVSGRVGGSAGSGCVGMGGGATVDFVSCSFRCCRFAPTACICCCHCFQCCSYCTNCSWSGWFLYCSCHSLN